MIEQSSRGLFAQPFGRAGGAAPAGEQRSIERGTDAGFGQCRRALVHGSVRPYNEAAGGRAPPSHIRAGRLTSGKAGTVRSASAPRPGRAQRKGARPEKQARGRCCRKRRIKTRLEPSWSGSSRGRAVCAARPGSRTTLARTANALSRHCSFAPPARAVRPRSWWPHRRTRAPRRLRYRRRRRPHRLPVRPASINLLRSIGWSHPGASSRR